MKTSSSVAPLPVLAPVRSPRPEPNVADDLVLAPWDGPAAQEGSTGDGAVHPVSLRVPTLRLMSTTPCREDVAWRERLDAAQAEARAALRGSASR